MQVYRFHLPTRTWFLYATSDAGACRRWRRSQLLAAGAAGGAFWPVCRILPGCRGKRRARLLNRRSRFDERIFVGMPLPESRLTYLEKAIERSGAQMERAELLRWRDDTDGLSIAHLRELIAGVLCLKRAVQRCASPSSYDREAECC